MRTIFAVLLIFLCGCASPGVERRSVRELEAKGWLSQGEGRYMLPPGGAGPKLSPEEAAEAQHPWQYRAAKAWDYCVMPTLSGAAAVAGGLKLADSLSWSDSSQRNVTVSGNNNTVSQKKR